MASELTKKERGFVKDYVRTGNGTLAALNNYDIDKNLPQEKRENVAAVMAHVRLRKDKIKKSIAERLPDDLLEERHLELLNKREVIRKFNGEGEIIDQPDTQAVSKGLEMAYKIKGTYAPEKHVNVNVDIDDESKAKTKQAIRGYLENIG